MTFCQYGCNQPATYFRPSSKKLPEGKWTCAKSPLSCPAVKQRRAATNIEKYGAANIFAVIHQREEFAQVSQAMRTAASDRMTDTSLGLGFSNPTTLQRANEAFKDKYGVEHTMQIPEAREKLLRTNMERYGAPCKVATMTQFQRSKIADEWLDSMGLTQEQREVWLTVAGKRIKVDGYDALTNMVYEFHGNYWHGNPRLFEADMYNKQAHKTMGQLYQATVTREAMLREHGFNVVIIWEDEFRRQR